MTVPAHPPLARPVTGRALGSLGGTLLVVEWKWRWYLRNWRATAVSSILQPLLFLLAFGVGFGALINGTGRAARATGGVDYLVWLAPALLCVSAVQTATFDSTYPVLSGFKWQQLYWGMIAAPFTPAQVAIGQLTWVALRMFTSGAAYLLLIAAVGGVTGWGILLSLLAATLCGTAFSALTIAFSASIMDEGAAFATYFRFVLIPMTLFAGTFFPVTQLPVWLRPVAWATPLWHGTELARGFALGAPRLWPTLGHLGYLVALLGLGLWLIRWRFTVRLYR
jgi:lipooligosaccharide transport system permease protein